MLLRHAIESMPVALLIMDDDYSMVEINSKGQTWFGSLVRQGDILTQKLLTHSNLPKTDFKNKSGHFQVGTKIFKFITDSFQFESSTYFTVCVVEDTEGYQSLSNAKTLVDALQKTTPKMGDDVVNDSTSNAFKVKCIESAGIGLDSDVDATMVLYSPHGTIVECTNGFRGYTREELIGTAAFDCIHPDDIPFMAQNHVSYFEDNRKIVPILSWFRKKHKKGHYVHVEFSGALRFGDNGESWAEGIERVLSTDRMDRVVSSVLNQIPCGVVMVDTHTGCIEMCNQHASNWLNIERDQNFESCLMQLQGSSFTEKEHLKLMSAVKRILQQKQIGEDEEVTVHTEQGKVLTFLGRPQGITDPGDASSVGSNHSNASASGDSSRHDVKSILWIINDVTELSRAMEKKTDSILQFMRCTSHDMRTPMQAIALAGHSIKDDLAAKGHYYPEIDTIIASSAVLETIVSNILEFKNINSMTLVKELSQVDVALKIDRIVTILRHSTLLNDDVKLSGLFPSWEPSLLLNLDEKMLDRIVLNIVSNSLKFTTHGVVEVICSVEPNNWTDDPENVYSTISATTSAKAISGSPMSSAEKESEEFRAAHPLILSITVRDTGRGMDATAVRHLGDIDFFSGDEGGFGLGTYIVATYIKFLRGTMHVVSEVGVGTEVTIKIPTSRVGLPMPSNTQFGQHQVPCQGFGKDCHCRLHHHHPDSAEGQERGKRSLPDTGDSVEKSNAASSLSAAGNGTSASEKEGIVLIVEDVAINRKLLVKSLRKDGYVVEEAENGEVALSMMLKNDYRTVFMDINMPVMNGDIAIRKYWEEAGNRTKHPKIIMLTGNITDADREMALDCGAHEYLTKPIRPVKLLEASNWIGEVPATHPGREVSEDMSEDSRSLKKKKVEE